MSLPKDPTEFNRPSRTLLTDADVDGLGRAVMTLCQELWVMKDRMMILEAVLEENGIDARNAVDNFQPSDALQERLNKDGRQLIERVISALGDTA